jgi:hypothetical protein
MRELADAERIGRLMRGLAAAADRETRIYFTGGATAVLLGWRPTTIDADILIVPESETRPATPRSAPRYQRSSGTPRAWFSWRASTKSRSERRFR